MLLLMAKMIKCTTHSLALLNFGQNAIFSVSLAAIMLMSAQEIMKGASVWLAC